MVDYCTAALEMCAILLNIKSKDEVIMPSYTFVSTANAFVLRGAKPVYVDIDPKTMNIDTNKIEALITNKTKAIIIVHYAGVSCDMEKIANLTRKYRIPLIEDAAQAILAKYKNKSLGSFGDLSALSFHESKNIHCGHGGALLINNKKFINRSEIIRDKGTNRKNFLNNLVNKYTWVDIGSSYGLDEINAAFLFGQLKQSKKIINGRMKIWKYYHNKLKKLELQKKIQRPEIPKFSKHNAHIYYIHILSKKRDQLIKYLKNKKICATFHYIPLHDSPYGIKISNKKTYLENTSKKSNTILRLPLYLSLKQSEIDYIIKTLKKIL